MTIAILVGHFGKGTGNSWNDRDEYEWAWMDAHTISKMLEGLGHRVIMGYVDRDDIRDRAFAMEFAEKGGLKDRNHAIRANMAIVAKADCAVEFHYNGFTDTSVKGHEVLIDNDEPEGSKSEVLARQIHDNLSIVMPLHPQRGVKRQRLIVTELLRRAGIPCCLVEPAFLFESILEDRRVFCGPYYKAVVDAIEAFGKSGGTA